MSSKALAFARFLGGLPEFLRNPLSVEEARKQVAHQFEDRLENFLRLMDEAVFKNPSSPYLPLLQSAGCEYGDLKTSIHRTGLEGTLTKLRSEGVYVSFEEFKGRKPIIRNGVSLQPTSRDFDNPRITGALLASTGGSTGQSAPVWLSLSFLHNRSAPTMLGYQSHRVMGVPTASFREPLPAPSIGIVIEDAHLGQVHGMLKTFCSFQALSALS